MDNLTANKSHIPCQSWVGQNGWSSTSTQVPIINPLAGSQHLGLGSSSEQRPSSYDHLQVSDHGCMSDLGATHPSALYKSSHLSGNPSPSTTLFAGSTIPIASHIISFAHQNPHSSSMLVSASQAQHLPPPPLPQTNQASQPCRAQQLPLLDSYKASFQSPLSQQGASNRLQRQPVSLPSCEQREQQRQWIPSSHCRGSGNKSLSDAAAHANKQSSQERNISQTISNDKQRLLLLHQRKQLLQRLEELDRLLNLNPADTIDDNSPQSTSQPPCEQSKTSRAQQVQGPPRKSKSRLSAKPPSPEPCESQTLDSPVEPALEAEAPKKASEQPVEESDPDFLPHSDGDDDEDDFSDFQYEPDDGSSDEPGHDDPSTPKGKKRPKSAGDPSTGETPCPPKKTTPETIVLACSNSPSKRVYDRRNYCLFCLKPVSRLSRHFEMKHSEKKEVAAAFQFPRKSKERQKIWDRLRKEGNFIHNKDVLKTGKGHLAAGKRPSHNTPAKDFLHCLYCRGLYVKRYMFRHMAVCPERKKEEPKIGKKRIAVPCALQVSDDLGITDGFKSVLTQMTLDEVTKAIMNDKVMLQYGELMFNQYGSDVKKHDYIRQNLRQTARLLVEAQKTTPIEKMQDFFLPSNFQHVVSAVKVLSGYDSKNKTYSVPSLAVKIGYNLQKTCGIVKDNAVKGGDAAMAESARRFLCVYKKRWNKLISSGALRGIREVKLRRAKKVPFAQDVKLLYFHLEKIHPVAEKNLRENPSPETYIALARVLLAGTIIFNRRGTVEVASVPLTAFVARKKSDSCVGLDLSVSDLERTMCEYFTRIDIRGKCGRKVPILLKPAFVPSLELLVELREKCDVPSQNPFLFGRPKALTAFNGSHCILKCVKGCGAKDPEVLTASKIRKHYTTMLQLMNLDDSGADQMLGPNRQVQTFREDGGLQQDAIQMASDGVLQAQRGEQAASWENFTNTASHYGPNYIYHEQAHNANMAAPRKPASSSRKRTNGSQCNGKQKWEEAEVLAVERHLMRLIREHRVPQKEDCIQCLEAEPEALSTRSWKGVKDYVRNRITALKRQSKPENAPPPDRKSSSGKVERQQGTGHYQQL